MTREQAELFVERGIFSPDVLWDPNFNWDLEADIFADAWGGLNFESTEPFYSAEPIVQDVYAKDSQDIFIPDVYVDDTGGPIGGPTLEAQAAPISIDVFGMEIPEALPAAGAPQVAEPTAAALPETQLSFEVEDKMPFDLDLTSSSTGFDPMRALEGAAGQAALDLFRWAMGNDTPPTAVTVTGQPYQIVHDTYAPGYCRTKKVCKISRAKNPRNPHFGKPVCPRMNPLNPKALARATRRLSGFQHFATKTEKLIRQSFMKAGVHPVKRVGGKCGTCRKTRCSC